MKTMLAARYLGPDRVAVEQVPLPEVRDEEALIEVEACGFCGSDINIIAGTHPRAKAPLTLGHEVSGKICQINSRSSHLKAGDKVAVFPLISCGNCHACKHGNPHVCRNLKLYGIDVDGGMAQFAKLPVSSLLRIPAEMPARIGALIEPLAVAVHGVTRTSLDDVTLAVVLGTGPIGLLTALVVQSRGIENVIISDVNPERRSLAQAIGLRAVEAGDALRRLVMQYSNSDGADVLFECAGHPSSAVEMVSLVRPRGVIVNLGVFKMPVNIDMQTVNFRELEILGSRVYTRQDFQAAIDLAPKLPLERVVSHAYSLPEVLTAFDEFKSGQACKAQILPLADSIESVSL
jgi:(R,R)-butanediol dehydrogenase / meso-butanediol dehydrogenase / diacetyl reductase